MSRFWGVCVCYFYIILRQSYIAWSGLEPTKYLRVTLTAWSSCLHFPGGYMCTPPQLDSKVSKSLLHIEKYSPNGMCTFNSQTTLDGIGLCVHQHNLNTREEVFSLLLSLAGDSAPHMRSLLTPCWVK